LPVPKSWATSLEVPTLYRTVDAAGKKRLIMFSGLYPVHMAVSEDDGRNWGELKPIGNFGGVVAMASCVPLKTGAGQYMALFHDEGRFIAGGDREEYRIKSPRSDQTSLAAKPWRFFVYQTRSADARLTWTVPIPIAMLPDADLCEPGAVRSPIGKEIAVLLREHKRKTNSFIIFTRDEGLTWTEPRIVSVRLKQEKLDPKHRSSTRYGAGASSLPVPPLLAASSRRAFAISR
jgi:hypothetical protein